MPSLSRYDNSPVRMALLAAFLVSFILLLSQRGDSGFTKSTQSQAEDVISPISQITSRPIRWVENKVFGMQDRNRAFEDNIKLRKELAGLRGNQARIDLLELKIKRYERILSTNIDADIPAEKIVARAVSETNGPFVRSLLLNTGTSDGVSFGNPVMSADGLVGHVISAGKNSSRVLQLGDLNSRIPIINKRSEALAILSGDNTARPLLAFAKDVAEWENGDVIITSGGDGLLPMGLPVGVVVKGSSEELRVKLHSESTPIDWVWVSPYRSITAPSEVSDGITKAPL